MRSRDLLLVCAAAFLASVVAIPLLGQPTQASELIAPPVPEPTPEPAPVVPVQAEVTAKPSEAGTAEGVFRKSEPVSTTGWTSGIIRGDIALTSSIMDQIQQLQVVVDEMRPPESTDGRRAFRYVQRVQMSAGTPSFEVRNVPFSAYGYVVSAYAPGLNGNQMTVEISEEHPLADEVRLAITPGAPFSLLLRDQDNGPLNMTEVRLVPTGAPLGRPVQSKSTDNFGSAVFENLLAGDYQVLVGPASAPLIEPQQIHVQSSGHMMKAGVPQPQGTTLVVPSGTPLAITVTDAYGNPLAGAAVRMQATDRRQLTMLEEMTDVRGQVRFSRVQAGTWQIDVSKTDYDRRFKQLTLDGREAPPEQRFELPRLR